MRNIPWKRYLPAVLATLLLGGSNTFGAPPFGGNGNGVIEEGLGYAILTGFAGSFTPPTELKLVYGSFDGGTDSPDDWEFVVDVSTEFGPFIGGYTNTVTNLQFGACYYYRAYISNPDGVLWGAPALEFASLAPQYCYQPGLQEGRIGSYRDLSTTNPFQRVQFSPRMAENDVLWGNNETWVYTG
jgi:hypothetical protein